MQVRKATVCLICNGAAGLGGFAELGERRKRPPLVAGLQPLAANIGLEAVSNFTLYSCVVHGGVRCVTVSQARSMLFLGSSRACEEGDNPNASEVDSARGWTIFRGQWVSTKKDSHGGREKTARARGQGPSNILLVEWYIRCFCDIARWAYYFFFPFPPPFRG